MASLTVNMRATLLVFHLCNKMPGENSFLGLKVRLQSTGA